MFEVRVFRDRDANTVCAKLRSLQGRGKVRPCKSLDLPVVCKQIPRNSFSEMSSKIDISNYLRFTVSAAGEPGEKKMGPIWGEGKVTRRKC